jgi:class 3 adenylate cyclase
MTEIYGATTNNVERTGRQFASPSFSAHTPLMRRRPPAPERRLATVLFTDIVGSTELAARLGDRGWRELIARHHAVVRGQLKRFGGRELDTAGDGFFAMFERPAPAVQCACAIVDGLQALGISIRAGIHMGECEVMGGKVGGIAVITGARVMGSGGPGDVLVSAPSVTWWPAPGSNSLIAARMSLRGCRGSGTSWRSSGSGRLHPLGRP